MRKIIATEFVSLDGVMQGPGGADEDRSGHFERGGWSFKFWNDETMKYKYDELFATGALLLGRVTYEIFAGAWPTLTDADNVKMVKEAGGQAEAMEATKTEENPFADRMNSLPKFVVSTTLKKVSWNNSTLIKGNIAQELSRLKQLPGQDIFIAGSSGLVQSLTQLDLIDEYRLMVFPIVLGNGKRLFKDGLDTKVLKLVETKPFKTGVVVLTYQPDRK
jgi:dihydrofolate reductase